MPSCCGGDVNLVQIQWTSKEIVIPISYLSAGHILTAGRQCDNETKFKGALLEQCKKHNVKVIN